jgi:sulfur-carrier protein
MSCSQSDDPVKLLYFASLRERIGKAEEDRNIPAIITTPRALVAWLIEQGEPYEGAFHQLDFLRVAIDQHHCDWDAPLAGAHEIAFFPPMTGG